MKYSNGLFGMLFFCAWASMPLPLNPPAWAEESLHLVHRQQVNPYDVVHVPRPNPNTEHVPLHTSFFLIVGTRDQGDPVTADSVTIELKPNGADAIPVLNENQSFAKGYSGRLFEQDDKRYGPGLAVYVKSSAALQPKTRYTVTVYAESAKGERLPKSENSWSFTTASIPETHTIGYRFNVADKADVEWHGEFFNGLAKPSFATSEPHRLPHYELISEVQKRFPRAWNLQRDAYLSGFEHQPKWFKNFPNIVREKETRRITNIVRENSEVVLHVEDFFGLGQYGIETNRPVSADYHAGNEVLIADGVSSARAEVIAVNDNAGIVRVANFKPPPNGWKIAYSAPLPDEGKTPVPGQFAPGGTYLRKFSPEGTPRYYWGRVNHEWDIVHGDYGRRVIPRFVDAIGCLAIDGGSGTTAKDLTQHHKVTRDITSHLIERYGKATLDWPWVVLNEPDLMGLYWRNRDWRELQRFYDYTVEAILRAFEDHGYDSNKVKVGGLELGAIRGANNLRLDDFLTHCSPNADSKDALTRNAAFADPRLNGQRSQRVEELCKNHDGMGSPLDFLSIHTYNTSGTAAAKLIRGKQRALEIDPGYYATLPVVSHETVPTWRPIIDPGAGGMYLGNGYFTSWMADYQARLLRQGARDARYAHGGGLLLMHWPGIVSNFSILNDTVRQIHLRGRTETIPQPSFHFVNLLSTLGSAYWVFPLEQIDGHTVSGFASMDAGDLRIVVYAHHHDDTASQSKATFDVAFDIKGLKWDQALVKEHRFDKRNNSYYRLARKHRDDPDYGNRRPFTEEEFDEIASQAELEVTATATIPVESAGVKLTVTVAGNGANFIILSPERK